VGFVTGVDSGPSAEGVSGGFGVATDIDVVEESPLLLIAEALVNVNGDNLVLSSGNVAEMVNQGTGGSAYDLDVVLGTAANGKPHPSGSMLLFGASGDYASTPDSAAASITGDIDICIRLSIPDFTPAATKALVSKWAAGAGNDGYLFRISAGGSLSLNISADGTIGVAVSSSENNALPDGEAGWLRVTWNDTTDVTKFYTSTDATNDPAAVNWTQLGTDRTLISAGIFDGTAPVEIGTWEGGATQPIDGSIYRAQILNGIDGTLAVSFDAADQTTNANGDTSTFVSSGTGETWTQNGNAFIQNTGKTAVHSIGTFGLETTAGQDIATSFTRFTVARFTDASVSADQYLWTSRSDAAKTVSVFSDDSNSDKWTFDAGGTIKALSEAYDNDIHVHTVQHNGGSTSKYTVSGVGDVTGDAGTETLDYGTSMADASAGLTAPVAVYQDLIFNSALTEAQVEILQNHLANVHGF